MQLVGFDLAMVGNSVTSDRATTPPLSGQCVRALIPHHLPL
jgi:hypothetical protein